MQTQTRENSAAVSAEKGIDVGKLEKEMASMWQAVGRAGEGSSAAAEPGVTRACVLNLIVYVTRQEDRTETDQLLDAVTEESPSRALILVADREANEAKLEAYVSTRCQVSARGAKQVCGEQVTIEAGGPVLETVASAIEPLLMPDVPVFLWWKDIPHYEDKLFNRLVEMADRVVIDSRAFDHPHEDLLRLAQIIREHPQFMLVSDLNWGRLTAWRKLIAGFWDVPAYRAHLEQIDSIVVEYDPPDVNREQIASQALLIVGWLASRLGWQVADGVARKEGASAHFVLQSGERQIKVEMRATADREGSDGLIATLTLRAGASRAEFYVAVNQQWTKLETEAKIGEEHIVGRVVAYEQKTEGQRLSRELSLLARDSVYEGTVAAATRLIETMK